MSHDHKDEVKNSTSEILSENYEYVGGGVWKRKEPKKREETLKEMEEVTQENFTFMKVIGVVVGTVIVLSLVFIALNK